MTDTGNENHNVIHVQFYDHATGQVFADANLPADQLPETFEARTAIQLKGNDWDVVEARPMTSAEFRRTGKLTLILRRVTTQLIDPADILFSLPTIANDALPPVIAGSSKINADVIEIHEDNWRQIEWVSATAINAIQSEFEAIRRIYDEQRVASGFKKCHLRKAVPLPLENSSFTVDDLRRALGDRATWLAGFGYGGVAGIAESSFAVRLMSSIEIFGVAANGIVSSASFANTRINNVWRPDITNLANFATNHDLLLVDWCAAAAIRATEEDYANYFGEMEL